MQTNCVINSNNLEAMSEMPDQSIDLIYCDPPFNTGRDFQEYSDNFSEQAQKSEGIAFEHREFQWLTGILSPSQLAYFASIIPVIREIHRLLKPSGALYWHCDYKTSHIVRSILNQTFGQPQFRNQIAWCYKSTAPFDTIKHCWKNNIDDILFYAKKEHDFEAQHRPLTHQQIKEKYRYTDSDGRKYRWQSGGTDRAAGLADSQKLYADENKGSRIETAWTDIPMVSGKERIGYPTQKPLLLLKRIVKASSKEEQIVLDPFCGSGTTLLAAKQLERQYNRHRPERGSDFYCRETLEMIQ